MAMFSKGDRVKIKGGRNLGTIVGFGTYKSADGQLFHRSDYEVRWDGYPFNVPVKEQNLVAANSALNAKFKKGDIVKVVGDSRRQYRIKEVLGNEGYTIVETDSAGREYAGREKVVYSDDVVRNSALNAKFKVGDVVEIVGSGLASRGWVGTVKSVGSGNGLNVKVQFPAGKYSNDHGEYIEDELRKVHNSIATTNEVVRNALEWRAMNAKWVVIAKSGNRYIITASNLESAKRIATKQGVGGGGGWYRIEPFDEKDTLHATAKEWKS